MEKAPVTDNENEVAAEGDNDDSEKKPSEPKEEEAPVPAAVSTQVALKDRLLAFFKKTTNQDKLGNNCAKSLIHVVHIKRNYDTAPLEIVDFL